MDLSPYVYSALTSESSIRLLEFTQTKQSPNAPLTCSLIEVSLEDNPDYVAQSYAWEGQESNRLMKIVTNASKPKRLMITETCENALRRFVKHWQTRHRKSPFRIWVDAVCIDQSNVNERNQQVSVMDRIYKTAAQVWVWLGHGDALSNKVMRRIPRLSTLLRVSDAINMTTLSLKSFLDKYYLSFEGQVGLALAVRIYWTRIWTLQEISLSQSVLLFCGEPTPVGYVHLRRVVRNFGERDAVTTFTLVKHMLLHADSPASKTGNDRLRLLMQSQANFATNPRDKIYGTRALGLGIFDSVPVDYSLPVEKIFHIATRALLEELNTFKVFEYGVLFPLDAPCPSWTIDWSQSIQLGWNSLFFTPPESKENSNGTNGCSISPFQLSSDGLYIQAHGYTIDTVDVCSTQMPMFPDDALNSVNLDSFGDAYAAYSFSPDMEEDLRIFRRWGAALSSKLELDHDALVQKWCDFLLLCGADRCVQDNKDLSRWVSVLFSPTDETKHVPEPESHVEKSNRLVESRSVEPQTSASKDDLTRAVWDLVSQDRTLAETQAIPFLFSKGQAFFITSNRRIGFTKHHVPEPGDRVVLIPSADHPILLRWDENKECYRLIGTAIVDSVMNGEAWPSGDKDVEEFKIG